MAYVPVENTIMTEMRFLWAGQQVEIGLYYLKAGGWTQGDMQTVGDILVGAWDEHCQPVTAATCILSELYFTNLESEFSWTYSYSDNLPMGGTAGTGSVPNNCSLALSFGTAGRGRSFRGRIYPPGMAEGFKSGNIVNETWMNAWLSFINISQTAMLVFGAAQTVVSRISDGLPRVAGLSTPITSVTFKDNVIDSQSRRLPGRGK